MGWQLTTHLALDALQMAIWCRQQQATDLSGLVHHSDRGMQAESFRGLFKIELIRPHGPWYGLDDLELATLEYIDWFNHRRLHGQIGMIPSAELEATYYARIRSANLT